MTGKAFIEGDAKSGFRVGYREPDHNYAGPIARIEFNEDWLYVVTDEHEGAAMLNIEALPMLRRALSKIAKEVAAQGTEARRAATVKQGAVHDGPVGGADAHNL